MDNVNLDSVYYTPLSGTPFKSPKKVRRLVCCDFDDTYLPFDDRKKKGSGIIGLEDFIDQFNDELGIALGWVSGSSINALLRKSEKYVRRLPHFIASSLGTEFYWVSENGILPSVRWRARIEASGFHMAELKKAVREIKAAGIDLKPQHRDYQGQMMECYFYIPSQDGARERDLIDQICAARERDLIDEICAARERDLIDQICAAHNIKVVMSGCNPAAGDPAGYMDAQFMPLPCGKAEAAAFAAESFGLAPADVWAFGDSLNDLQMLSWAGNSFLVGNADPAAVARFGRRLDGQYCHGIRAKLGDLLEREG